MALLRNGRTVFQATGRHTAGVYGNQTGNFIKGGLRARFFGGFNQRFGGYPNGSLAPSSFILPQKAGSITSYTSALAQGTGSASLTPARNLSASSSSTITVTVAQLDQIVSMIAAGLGAISTSSANLAASISMTASSSGTITVSASTLGAIISSIASSSATMSGAGSTLTALANMEASSGGPPALSPEALANAVLDALLADHNLTGTVGEALNSVGASGNPWSSDLTTNNDPGTFGERIQKLLTKGQFLGLK